MRLMKFSPRLVLGISLLLGFYNCSVFVSGVPQWVWNPEASTAPISQQASNKVVFHGQNTVSDKDKDKENIQVEIVDTQARLFPTIISALSNSINGGGHRPGGSSSSSSSSSSSGTGSSSHPGGGGGGGGGSSSNGGSNSGTSASCNGGSCMCTGSVSGACVGSAIASQAINQGINAGNSIAATPSIFGNFLQNFLGGSGGASTLPAGLPGGLGGSSSNKEPESSCTCVDSNSCFLPSKPSGSCDGGSRVRCCSTTRGTRTYFPDEEDRLSNVRQVTRSQIRRQLFRNIVRGSGSIIDDTLDLVLHPFLSKNDQDKVAIRLLRDS